MIKPISAIYLNIIIGLDLFNACQTPIYKTIYKFANRINDLYPIGRQETFSIQFYNVFSNFARTGYSGVSRQSLMICNVIFFRIIAIWFFELYDFVFGLCNFIFYIYMSVLLVWIYRFIELDLILKLLFLYWIWIF